MLRITGKRKKELRTALVFVVILAASLGAGYLCGRFLGKADIPSFTRNSDTLFNLSWVFTVGFWIVNLLSFSVSIFLYLRLRTRWKNSGGEDDSLLDQIEYEGNYPMMICSVMLVLNLLLFAVCVWLLEYAGKCGAQVVPFRVPVMLAFAFGYLWIMILQAGMIGLEKEMNPEKQGNILDLHFQRVWMNSCDEAQRTMAYRAAYSAFKATNLACMISWVVSFISIFVFNTGLLPVILVIAIYMSSLVSFHMAAMKEERHVR